ncbi:MAG TPA: GTP cyclohydrolase FolE2 [Thermodesulfobacteriota bacterium]|nr:GTP cyclohydrolase FolE2 [Thermodesulfobacteriota bacterium]HQO77374.1 GTP cyclohydrolase FolE2 [Thermodesulfobacteriota bacterium]
MSPEEDIQNQPDYREIEIRKVGVKNIKYPITVRDKAHGFQHTIATVNMYVNLPHQFKGTHMSRFVEILNQYRLGIDLKNLPEILREMKTTLNAESAHVEIEFPYFIEKEAPVSGARGLMEYTCRFIGSADGEAKDRLIVGIDVPVTTLCPCSKAISESGAHNQRSRVSVHLRFKKFFWIEDVISLVEASASSPVYSLLKREDEKYVTEQAYENPRFVEDVVRGVAEKLAADQNFTWFSVESENMESIHNHNAYAMVEKNGCKGREECLPFTDDRSPKEDD